MEMAYVDHVLKREHIVKVVQIQNSIISLLIGHFSFFKVVIANHSVVGGFLRIYKPAKHLPSVVRMVFARKTLYDER